MVGEVRCLLWLYEEVALLKVLLNGKKKKDENTPQAKRVVIRYRVSKEKFDLLLPKVLDMRN